ncbi:hypothetical protein [Paenibacillus hexagrammi]|uniref:Uncharacterized protein n=1 Tax=Paenibacillus hexagrammi TaxID=2908839 RepID=A0ABY3SEF9_9BACL|nr:hypothetical protein [Paenibacillus sp. YPD9-1]UJF31536.1 hypothetical protein L0M14_17165 [Paenibacillus sp. YPD9-1]
MTYSDFVSGSSASILSQTITLVILVLIFVVSLRLFLDRRKKGYLSMTISLVILGIHDMFQLYVLLTPIHTSMTAYISLMLKIISFILVNMGIYQLYNRTSRRQYVFFYGLIILGFVVSMLHFYVPRIYQGAPDQVLLLQNIGLELYIFVLIFLCFYMVPPHIGQQIKYQVALTVFFQTSSPPLEYLFIRGFEGVAVHCRQCTSDRVLLLVVPHTV